MVSRRPVWLARRGSSPGDLHATSVCLPKTVSAAQGLARRHARTRHREVLVPRAVLSSTEAELPPGEPTALQGLLATGYTFIAVFWAVWGAGLMIAPQWVARGIWGLPPSSATEPLLTVLRLASSVAPATVTSAWALQSCAAHGRLGHPAFARLNLALLLVGLGNAGLQFLAGLPNPSAHLTTALVAFLGSAAVATTGLVAVQGTGRSPLSVVLRDAQHILEVTEWKSASFLFLTLASVGVSALCLLQPQAAVGFLGLSSPLSAFYTRSMGAGMLFVAMGFLTLKDSANRRALGGLVSVGMSIGLGASAVLQVAVLVHALSVGAAAASQSATIAVSFSMATLVVTTTSCCQAIVGRLSK